MVLERQEMAISRDNEFGLCSDRTFKYAIVRFIFEDMESGSRTQDCCRLTDSLNRFSDFVFCPIELRLKDSCRFGQDGNRRIQLKRAMDSFEIGVLGISSWNGEGSDVDVSIEDDLHDQRPWNTSFSTSASVRTPFFLALFTP